jgi:hypothetical protein
MTFRRKAGFDDYVLSFDEALLVQTLAQAGHRRRVRFERSDAEIPNHRHRLCCARAASGQATAAPPSVAKNFRRAM